MPNEADTCRNYDDPKLRTAGWEEEPHRVNDQVTLTDAHFAFNAPVRTRRQRARRLRAESKDLWGRHGPEAQAVVDELLDNYAVYAMAHFVIADVLEVPPVAEHGNVLEIAAKFGGEEKLIEAVQRLQTLLYAA